VAGLLTRCLAGLVNGWLDGPLLAGCVAEWVAGWLWLVAGWLLAASMLLAGGWLNGWLSGCWPVAGWWLLLAGGLPHPGVPFPGLFCFMAPVFVFGNLNLVCIIVVLYFYFHYSSQINIIIIITSLTFKIRVTFITVVMNIITSMLLLDND
jgi:hypothetical protein